MSHGTASRLVILGATGDLTGRYLLPALAELEATGQLPTEAAIVGVGLDAWDDETFRHQAGLRLARHAARIDRTVREALTSRLEYVHGDVTDAETVAAATEGSAPLVVYGPPARRVRTGDPRRDRRRASRWKSHRDREAFRRRLAD